MCDVAGARTSATGFDSEGGESARARGILRRETFAARRLLRRLLLRRVSFRADELLVVGGRRVRAERAVHARPRIDEQPRALLGDAHVNPGAAAELILHRASSVSLRRRAPFPKRAPTRLLVVRGPSLVSAGNALKVASIATRRRRHGRGRRRRPVPLVRDFERVSRGYQARTTFFAFDARAVTLGGGAIFLVHQTSRRRRVRGSSRARGVTEAPRASPRREPRAPRGDDRREAPPPDLRRNIAAAAERKPRLRRCRSSRRPHPHLRRGVHSRVCSCSRARRDVASHENLEGRRVTRASSVRARLRLARLELASRGVPRRLGGASTFRRLALALARARSRSRSRAALRRSSCIAAFLALISAANRRFSAASATAARRRASSEPTLGVGLGARGERRGVRVVAPGRDETPPDGRARAPARRASFAAHFAAAGGDRSAREASPALVAADVRSAPLTFGTGRPRSLMGSRETVRLAPFSRRATRCARIRRRVRRRPGGVSRRL